MIGKRNGARIGLEPNIKAALRPDLGDPRRAELVGPASPLRRRGGAGGEPNSERGARRGAGEAK